MGSGTYMRWVKVELLTAACAGACVLGLWLAGIADWTLILAVPLAIVILGELLRDQWVMANNQARLAKMRLDAERRERGEGER